jgi:hypothetical protein
LSTPPAQSETVAIIGAAGINGVDGINPGDSGTDGGPGGAATAIAGPNGDSSSRLEILTAKYP